MLLMDVNTKRLRQLAFALGLCGALLGGGSPALAASNEPAPVPLGGNSYRITREAKTAFARATAPLKYEAQGDAEEFCRAQGKRMKLVSVDEEKASIVRGGFSRVTVVFKALSPGDPELAGDPLGGQPVMVDAGAGRLAQHLQMLEVLHNDGILTDKEYKAAKKRLGERVR